MDETCQMMLSGPGEGLRCHVRPTVGGNGMYRYCERHMRMAADASATTLVWDCSDCGARPVLGRCARCRAESDARSVALAAG